MGGTSSSCSGGGEGGQGNGRRTSLDDLCRRLSSGEYKNVVVMCGAGVSTNAGVPDFRSPSAGLYFKLRKYDLPYPEAIFEGTYFRRDPKPFYGLVREIYPERLCPTTAHKFFALLHHKGILRRVYTQNIDALEFLAGLPEDKVVEAHGTFMRSYCVSCKHNYDLGWLKRQIFSPSSNEGVPKCDRCGGVVRPDVVLFGESLPERFWSCARQDFPECDLLLVLGTSLVVAPFNSLVAKPRSGVPRVYINKTRPGTAGGILGWIMGMGRNINFSDDADLILLGDCDERSEEICRKAGWAEELKNVEVQIMEP